MGVIYVRQNLINGKKYVGQAKVLKKRQNDWKNLNIPYAGEAINNARAKYGIDNFGFEILKECEDEKMNYWETYYIKKLNTKKPYGYNMTDGGDGRLGCLCSEQTKRKIGEAHKGKKLSEEHKKKISETRQRKTVFQIDKNTNVVVAEFQSTKEIQRQLGFNSANISMCCNGKKKTCGGFIWRYKE